MRTRFGIADGTLAGKLVALLPVFASTLAVALACDHGATGPFAADITGCETQIDQCKTVLHSFCLMLDAARVHGNSAIHLCESVCRALNRFGQHTGFLFNPSRLPSSARFTSRFDPL